MFKKNIIDSFDELYCSEDLDVNLVENKQKNNIGTNGRTSLETRRNSWDEYINELSGESIPLDIHLHRAVSNV